MMALAAGAAVIAVFAAGVWVGIEWASSITARMIGRMGISQEEARERLADWHRRHPGEKR